MAKASLENWEHDRDTLDKMLSQFRISSNAVYPFCQNGAVCFLRLAPRAEKMEKNVLGEMEFIDYLCGCGYPALKPMRAKTGETCLQLDTEWGQFYATAFRRVAGVPIGETDLSSAVVFAYGKALGRLHALSAQFVPKVKKWTHGEVLTWMAAVLSEYSAPDPVVSELVAVKGELDKLAANRGNYGLIHFDFEPDNVFYDREEKTCAVIDFDDGMYHWFALDVEQVFGALAEEISGEGLLSAKSTFIRGYQEEHDYTPEMEESLPLMRRFINLYDYARLIRCVAEGFADEPAWLVELRGVLGKAILEKEARIVQG